MKLPTSLGRLARLLGAFVARDLHARYAGSLLGLFWSILNPVLHISVLALVFSVFLGLRFGEASFVPALIIGFLPWMAVQEGALRAGVAVIDHPTLLKSVRFPPMLLPLAMIAAALVHQLLATVAVGGVLLTLGPGLTLTAASIATYLLALAAQIALTTGLGLVLSATAVFVRDAVQVAGALMLAWMYATPIAWPVHLVPERWHWILQWNPLAHVVCLQRAALLGAAPPGGQPGFEPSLPLALAAGAALLLSGLWCFHRLTPHLVDEL